MAKTVTVAIVGYPGCSAWITAGLLELFAIANNARATLGNRASSTIRFDCHIVGRSRSAVRGSHGVRFTKHAVTSRGFQPAPLERRRVGRSIAPVSGGRSVEPNEPGMNVLDAVEIGHSALPEIQRIDLRVFQQ